MAAVLWSTGGAFTKVLTQDTFAHLNEPPLDTFEFGGYQFPIQIACYRALFAGLVLLPTLRRQDLAFRPPMIWMALSFAVMNVLFVTAMALGTSANAILLQYSAPLWMYLAAIFLLGERADRRGTIALVVGLAGIAIIVAGGWKDGDPTIIMTALGSGFAYAGVLLGLRILRGLSSRWLTVWNHLLSGLVLLPLVIALRPPTLAQFIVLFFYGSLQMGLAYWLVARGLRVVSPQEAGTITLLEPILESDLGVYGLTPNGGAEHSDVDRRGGYTRCLWRGGIGRGKNALITVSRDANAGAAVWRNRRSAFASRLTRTLEVL